jgi:4-amino-4-deoxy-L-arabinose transferase-like glycosyltransferase
VDRATVSAVIALTALAAVLRILMAHDDLWGDELYLYDIVHARSLGRALAIVHDTESTPPLYFILAWVAARIGHDDQVWIRVPSLVLSTTTVPLLYALGASTVGRRAALIGTALFAIAPFDLFYGSEARAYSTVAFFCTASTLSLIQLVRTGSRRWIVALAVTTAGAAYTHYVVVFVLAAQLAWALWWHRQRARMVLAAYAGAALLYLPWVPSALVQFDSNTSERVLAPGSADQMAEAIAKIWFGHPFVPFVEMPGRAATVAIGLGLVTAGAFALQRALRRRTPMAPNTVLIVALAAITPVAALLYELGPNSIFLPRYLSASIPAGLLVVGAVLVAARRPMVVAAATLAVLGGVAVGTLRALEPDGRRPDYRSIARELDRVAAPSAPVLELSIFVGPPAHELGYFFKRSHEYFATGRPLDSAWRLGRRAGRFYVVVPEGAEGVFMRLLQMDQHGFRLVERREWRGLHRLVLRTYAPAPSA